METVKLCIAVSGIEFRSAYLNFLKLFKYCESVHVPTVN